jgi:LysR family hydrogen peroxide-inducible transcriptional activator
MEIHQIRYFLALADLLNFTKAAETCNVSQPSLTRAIKLLEEELGGPLFHRERANTHLSELGRMVKPHLQQIYYEVHQAKRLARDFTRLNKSTLNLGVMCTIAPDQIIDLIGSIQRHHPGVELQLTDANARGLQERLIAGALELALYCIPGEEPDPRLHVMPLFRERFMIVVHPEHALASRDVIRVSDLNGERYLDRVNCEFDEYADPIFDQQGAICETVYRSERDDWILAMIAAGLGFGFMPEYSIDHAGVVARPLAEPEFWREVNLVTVHGRPHSPAVGAFVREAMRKRWRGQPAIAVRTASEKRMRETHSVNAS